MRKYEYLWNAGNQILAITNGSDVTEYAYDAAGQLTNDVTSTATNDWVYDEAGNWLNAAADSQWVYNQDNEIVGLLDAEDDPYTNITVTGEVEPGTQSNKWYNTWADCRSASAQVSQADGTFSLENVPAYPGHNALVVTVTDVSGNTTNQTVNVTNDSVTLDETFLHDANGNLTNWVSGAQNWTYEWDWANRLTKVSSNGVVLLQNWYDANSRRVAKMEVVSGQTNEWIYLYDGWDIVGVMDEDGNLQETYARGFGLAGDIGTLVAVTHHTGANAGTYYTHHNHRGDLVLVRSGTTTTATYDYSAFGKLSSSTGTDLCRFKFSSKEREESCGFSYYGYRFYAPQWQRWLNRDPIGDSAGANAYSFVENVPVTIVDPDGLQGSTKNYYQGRALLADDSLTLDCLNPAAPAGPAPAPAPAPATSTPPAGGGPIVGPVQPVVPPQVLVPRPSPPPGYTPGYLEPGHLAPGSFDPCKPCVPARYHPAVYHPAVYRPPVFRAAVTS